MDMVELHVRMDCNGCARKVRKALLHVKGVDNVEIDLPHNKVTVMGYVDRKKVLKAVRKTGKSAEFWQFSYPSSISFNTNLNAYQGFYQSQQQRSSSMGYSIDGNQPFARTYNYRRHGYNNMPQVDDSVGVEHATTVFSDENPNACTIM